MPSNPFIEFYQDPVGVLATLAYALLILAVTVALAGVMWSTALWLSNAWGFRHVDGKFGPKWEYVPPMGLWLRVSGLLLLAAIEAFLLSTLFYLV